MNDAISLFIVSGFYNLVITQGCQLFHSEREAHTINLSHALVLHMAFLGLTSDG